MYRDTPCPRDERVQIPVMTRYSFYDAFTSPYLNWGKELRPTQLTGIPNPESNHSRHYLSKEDLVVFYPILYVPTPNQYFSLYPVKFV